MSYFPYTHNPPDIQNIVDIAIGEYIKQCQDAYPLANNDHDICMQWLFNFLDEREICVNGLCKNYDKLLIRRDKVKKETTKNKISIRINEESIKINPILIAYNNYTATQILEKAGQIKSDNELPKMNKDYIHIPDDNFSL
jgi:hypothetical protein